MTSKKNQHLIVIGLSVASVVYAIVEVIEALKEQATSVGTNIIWSIAFALLIALWSSNDAKQRDLYEPYESSFFIFLFWPFVLPYHLVKTRGTEGFLVFLGALSLYVFPFFSGLVTWAYFT